MHCTGDASYLIVCPFSWRSYENVFFLSCASEFSRKIQRLITKNGILTLNFPSKVTLWGNMQILVFNFYCILLFTLFISLTVHLTRWNRFFFHTFIWNISEAYLEPCQTSMMKMFVEIVKCWKGSVIDFW